MGLVSMLGMAVTVVNLALLTALGVVWVRNYRTFGSPLLLGLVVFAVVLFVENAVAVYFYFSTGMLFAMGPFVETTVAAMRGLQFVALLVLTWVTMQ
jgi:hypothetical protein